MALAGGALPIQRATAVLKSGASYASVNGSNRRLNEFLVDGIPNNVSDRANYLPPVDVVEEFTIQTNALDAEYGNGGGAYVNMTSKSGTNQFHGQLYEFLQNDKLNANSFLITAQAAKGRRFDKTSSVLQPAGQLSRTESSGSSTGRAFARAGQRQPSTLRPQTCSGRATSRGPPFSTRTVNGQLVRDPLAGNRIPASRINPVVIGTGGTLLIDCKRYQIIPKGSNPQPVLSPARAPRCIGEHLLSNGPQDLLGLRKRTDYQRPDAARYLSKEYRKPWLCVCIGFRTFSSPVRT
jgi:hypothetical protein